MWPTSYYRLSAVFAVWPRVAGIVAPDCRLDIDQWVAGVEEVLETLDTDGSNFLARCLACHENFRGAVAAEEPSSHPQVVEVAVAVEGETSPSYEVAERAETSVVEAEHIVSKGRPQTRAVALIDTY
jgi:hypothetical protein